MFARQSNPRTSLVEGIDLASAFHYLPASTFPTIRPVHWLTSHFAVGGYSPLRRLSGMLTAHMTQIAPRNGFTWHPHRGLEIYTVMIDGELYHEDNAGGNGILRAGDVQRMFSGDYILHQELNLSNDAARVIQIWFVADSAYQGLEPHYEQVPLGNMCGRQVGDGIVRDVIGPRGATDAHVRARLTDATVPAGGEMALELPEPGEDLFLYVIDGDGRVDTASMGGPLQPFDVILAGRDADPVNLHGGETALRVLSFYLPTFLRPERA